MAEKKRPLVVDLDGTLTKTDTLYELAAHFVTSKWSNVFTLLSLLRRDRATLKTELAKAVDLDVSLLPMNSDVLTAVHQARQEKRPVVLATASSMILAKRISEAWGPFDLVLASTPGDNLKASRKAEALVERFGEKGFDYVGNDTADLPVLEQAHTGYLVMPRKSLLRKAQKTGTPVEVLRGKEPLYRAFMKALRPHQWTKNILLAVPVVAGQVFNAETFLSLFMGIVAFSVMASAIYLLNDFWDLAHDRTHPTKSSRPLASGDIPLWAGAALVPALFSASLLLSGWYLGENFTLVLGLYAATSFLYSAWLKRLALVDVFVLAGLYGLRIGAGGVAVSISLSPWLIAFSLFAFLSLALLKRHAELNGFELNSATNVRGRGYLPSDSILLALFGATSGFLASVILALYIEDPTTRATYSEPLLLWIIVPSWLYWISRMWLLTHRGKYLEDPVLFALTDRVSYGVGFVLLLALIVAR